jgi:DNA recombination protein RmuC
MEPVANLVPIAVGVALLLGLLLLWRRLGVASQSSGQVAPLLERVTQQQQELAGRLASLGESQLNLQAHLSDRMAVQERELGRALDEKLRAIDLKLAGGMQQNVQQTNTTMTEIRERLAVIDAAQTRLTNLSEQVVSLQDILGNKQARGAFGEVQLENLVTMVLPPNAYRFQATIGNSVGNARRVDCLLDLPNPPGPMAVDAKFPLESYQAMIAARESAVKDAARKQFAAAVLKHAKDIAARYIIPGETADSALMFLPSEAVYAELFSECPEVVEKCYALRVWPTSPTTLMALLNTIRAVLRDVQIREQAGEIQKLIKLMLEDVGRLGERVDLVRKQFGTVSKTLDEVDVSRRNIAVRGNKIVQIELQKPAGVPLAEVLPTPLLPEEAAAKTALSHL